MFLYNCFFDPSKDVVVNYLGDGGFGKMEKVDHNGIMYARKKSKICKI